MKYDNLLTGISETLLELGTISNMAPIQNGVKIISKTQKSITTDYYVSKAIQANKSHPFWQFFPNYKEQKEILISDFFLKPIYIETNRIKRIGEDIAAFAIIVIDDNFVDDEDVNWNYFIQNVSQYAIVLLLNYTSNDKITSGIKKIYRGKLFCIEMIENPSESMEVILNETLTTEIKQNLLDKSSVNTIYPLLVLTKELVQQEQNLATVRKNINSQMTNIIRKDETSSNINDVFSSVKTQIQYWNTDTEKIIKAKYEELNKPITGKYSDYNAKLVNQIVELEKSESAEKSEKLNSSLSNDYLINVEKSVRNKLTNDFTNDYNLIVSSIEGTIQNINKLLVKRSIITNEKQGIFLDYTRFPDPTKTVSNYTSFTKYYSGEFIKEGIMEYFIALREYTGLIMVVVGLLAPLNMISSASDLDFLKSYAESLKNFNKIIKVITAVVTIGMIFFGFYELRKAIPKRRKENFDRELRKAKETIQAEVKRMFNDSSKDWQSNLSQWLREVSGQLQQELEKKIREYNENQQQKINLDKVKLQKMNQSFDTNSKRVSNAERMIDNLLRSHKDAVNDIEKSFR
jgi:hypothetical protein